jgi:archaellum component FlaC
MGRVSAESEDARLAELAARLDRMEQELAKFQAAIAGKLAQALRYLHKRDQLRDKRVRDSLRQVASDLAAIKQQLEAFAPPRITH